jgi:hypothetical protein
MAFSEVTRTAAFYQLVRELDFFAGDAEAHRAPSGFCSVIDGSGWPPNGV